MCSPSNVSSLYAVSLEVFFRNIDERKLERALIYCPVDTVFEIMWKVLNVNPNSPSEFDYDSRYSGTMNHSIIRGQDMVLSSRGIMYCGQNNPEEPNEYFNKHLQTKFNDNLFNMTKYFTLDLFFKLVNYTKYRNKLFTIFQICVQVNGLQFPKKLALDWINIENEDDSNNFHFQRIQQGLKLGVFLGDAGWLCESALVLSYTYNISTSKWVCDDKNLKLTKAILILTKWLLVTSNYYNFDEAKLVFGLLIETINIFETIRANNSCTANCFVSISQYFFVLMEFKESWLWAEKAVYELRNESSENLKISVISHAVKVSSVSSKRHVARKLVFQLRQYGNKIEQNIHANMLLNEAFYIINADLPITCFQNFFIALDSKRHLFGYLNLNTALVLLHYAYARYLRDPTVEFSEAGRAVSHCIYIMKTLGMSDDNMLVINARQIKALTVQEKLIALHVPNEEPLKSMLEKMNEFMIKLTEDLHLKSLEASLKAFDEKSLMTARSYCCLGRHYQNHGNHEKSRAMHLKAIKIKESILGINHPEVAICLNHLASLYTFQLNKLKEAEFLLLRSQRIFKTEYSHPFSGILLNLKGLKTIYRHLNKPSKYNYFQKKIMEFNEARLTWLWRYNSNNYSIRNRDLNMDDIKFILFDNSMRGRQ